MEELIPIFLFLSTAAVLILRPITKKLGVLLEAIARSKMGTPAEHAAEVAHLRVLVDQLSKRLDLVDERQDFTERLVSNAQRQGFAAAARLDPGVRPDPVFAGRADSNGREREPEYLSR